MVESAWQLADASPPEERLLPALFNLDDFKVSQAGDEARGDWVLAARPDVAPHEAGVARKEFVAAMEAWDHERADRALVALLPHVDQDAFFDILWPFGLRCFRAVGHKIIFAAHVDRVLRRIGWRYAEPALRSLIFGLLDKGRDQDTASWVRGGVKAATLPTGWQGGQADPDASVALMAKLRVSDPSGAQDLVAGALGTGIAASSVWDAVRLAASDLFQRRPALLPVHAVTVTNALGYVARRTQDDGLRRRILLQAAAWIPVIRDAINLPMDGKGIEALPSVAAAGAAPEDPVGETTDPRVALQALTGETPVAAFEDRLRRQLFCKGVEHHQHKYAAAVLEERRLVHPRFAPWIVAPSVAYLPGAGDDPSAVFEKAGAVLRSR
jgi:hypothetical protein